MAPITADMTAAWLPLYLEPGDGLALPITLPAGYETGEWVAYLYRDAASSVPIATMGATILGQVLTVSMTDDAVALLTPRGTSRFAGLWRSRHRPVSGEWRTWFKGFFVVDGGLSIPANGATAVTVTVAEPIVIVTSTAVDVEGVTEADLAQAVAAEAALRTTADNAEIAARAAAITAEAGARTAADSAEASARAAADTALDGRVATREAMGDPVTVAHGGTSGTTVALGRDGLGLLSPGAGQFEGATLRAWRAGWAGRKAAPCRALLVGTSNMVGYYSASEASRQSQLLASLLESANGQRHQVGWYPKHSLTSYLQPWTVSGAATDNSASGLGYGAVNLNPPSYIETTVTCSRFWISYTLGNLIGGFQVFLDGVQQGTVWGSGGSGGLVGGNLWDSGPLARASRTIRIQAVDGFGFPVRFEGMLVFDGAENTSGAQGTLSQSNAQTGSGVTVINGGLFGSSASTFGTTSATGSGVWWTDGLAKLNPCLIVAEFITNEITGGASTTTYKNAITAMWNQVLAVYTAASLPPPSLLLRIPHATGATAATIAPFRVATYEVAATIGAAVLDLSVATGFVGTSAADVYAVTSAIDGATRVHLSDRGHRLAAEMTADYLLRAVGFRGAGLDTAGLLPTNALPPITTAEVTDGTLVNADVSASAGLALSKLATQAAGTAVANTTGGAAVPTAVAISSTLKTALALVKADVGLGSVDNTSDAAKPVSTATSTALGLKADKSLSQRTISGTTDTPVLGDAGTRMRTSNAAATTVTVPPSSSVAYPAGTVLEWCQGGAGQLTLAPGAGVTLNAPAGLKTRVQFSPVTAVLTTTTDVWDIAGDTTT